MTEPNDTRIIPFVRMLDDAAVFPPGRAPLSQAVADHVAHRDVPAADLIGPLVLPLELVAEADRLAGEAPLEVSVVTPAGALDSVAATIVGLAGGSTRVVAVELKVAAAEPDDVLSELDAAKSFAASRPDLRIWVELPAALVVEEVLGAIRGAGFGLKFRTGGLDRKLFPTPEELIDVLARAVRAGVPFKLTAGLHRALRYHNPKTGFDHFGFLNIAAATHALRRGVDRAEAATLLNSDDPASLVAELGFPDAAPGWREAFTSFGTCSVGEPVATLNAVGVLPDGLLEGLDTELRN